MMRIEVEVFELGIFRPCGLNTPHTHPRATEINFSVNGTLLTGLLVENGARFITNELKAGMATVFPQGAIHFEMNTGCGESFGSEAIDYILIVNRRTCYVCGCVQ